MCNNADIAKDCPCTCCPKYQELIDWADHLEEVAVRLERDDDYYHEAVAEILLLGWESEFARVGIHNWRQSPQIDLEDNQQAVQMQSRGEEIPDDFFQEDLSGYFFGYSSGFSLSKSVNTSARGDIIQAFRDKAAAAREIGNAGLEYCEQNSDYIGVDGENIVLDYFCTRDPALVNQNVWNHLYATGFISYGTWEDATNRVLEDLQLKAAILAGVVGIIAASRSIFRTVFRAGTPSVLKMSRRQFSRLRTLARRQLTNARMRITTMRVYRVEGGGNAMIHVSESGNVLFIKSGKMFYLNGGHRRRALQLYQQRLNAGFDAQLKSFRIPRSFVRELDETAIRHTDFGQMRAAASAAGDMAEVRRLENLPHLVDVTKAPRQFGLRQSQLEALEKVVVQGTGRVEL